jgi:hypothetical protein
VSDAQRRKNDIGRLERPYKSAERAVNQLSAETAESALSAIFDSSIADGVDEHLRSPAHRATAVPREPKFHHLVHTWP